MIFSKSNPPGGYYLYFYLRKSNLTPYYVGKGKDTRAWDKDHKVMVPDDNTRIVISEYNLTSLGALALERRYIKWYGRKDLGTGILRNMTNGGEGGGGKKRGSKHTAATSVKMRDAWTEQRRIDQSNRTTLLNANRPITTCKHCGFQGTHPGNMQRWHNDNCASINPKEPNIRSKQHKKAISWIATSPKNEEVIVYNLRDFCRINNLNSGTMCDVALGHRRQHKGWTISILQCGDTSP